MTRKIFQLLSACQMTVSGQTEPALLMFKQMIAVPTLATGIIIVRILSECVAAEQWSNNLHFSVLGPGVWPINTVFTSE